MKIENTMATATGQWWAESLYNPSNPASPIFYTAPILEESGFDLGKCSNRCAKRHSGFVPITLCNILHAADKEKREACKEKARVNAQKRAENCQADCLKGIMPEEKMETKKEPTPDEVKAGIVKYLHQQSGSKLGVDEWKNTSAGKSALTTADSVVSQRGDIKEGEAMKKILKTAYDQTGSTASFDEWMKSNKGTEAKRLALALTETVMPTATQEEKKEAGLTESGAMPTWGWVAMGFMVLVIIAVVWVMMKKKKVATT